MTTPSKESLRLVLDIGILGQTDLRSYSTDTLLEVMENSNEERVIITIINAIKDREDPRIFAALCNLLQKESFTI